MLQDIDEKRLVTSHQIPYQAYAPAARVPKNIKVLSCASANENNLKMDTWTNLTGTHFYCRKTEKGGVTCRPSKTTANYTSLTVRCVRTCHRRARPVEQFHISHALSAYVRLFAARHDVKGQVSALYRTSEGHPDSTIHTAH